MTAFQNVQYSPPYSYFPELVSETYQHDQASQTAKFECHHCDAILSSKILLKHHEIVHRVVYDCTWTGCSSRFVTKSDYKLHMNAHNEKFFPCAYCPTSCDAPDHYKNHVRKHVEKPLFTCCFCPSKFDQRALLRKHERLHNKMKFVHLYKPHTVAKLKKIVKKSMKKVRRSFKPEIQRCTNLKNVMPLETDSDSSEQTDTESSNGTQNQNQNDINPAQPPLTRAGAKRQSEITSTECECGNSAFFKCALCKYSSNRIQLYQKHAIIHTRKTGKYTCAICEAHFLVKVGLNKHQTNCH